MKLTSRQRLFTHGGVYTLSNILNRALGFFMIPVYAHFLGAEGYGLVSLMVTVSLLLSLLFSQGLGGAWFRLRFDRDGAEAVKAFESSTIWYLLLSSALGVFIVWLLGEHVTRICLPGVTHHPIVVLAALHAGAIVFSMIFEEKLQAEQRPAAFLAYGLVRLLLTAGLILLFVVILERDVQGKLEAEAIAAGALALTVFVLIRPASPTRIRLSEIKDGLVYGLPVMSHLLLGMLNDAIDRFLINGMLGLAVTGVYAMGYNLSSIVRIISLSFTKAYAPMFIKSVKASGGEDGAGLADVERGALLIVTTACCVGLGISGFGREAIWLLTPPEFSESWRVLAPVTSGIVAMTCYSVFVQPIYYGKKSVRSLPLLSGMAVVANVGGNLALIPVLGMMGAALATLGSNALIAVAALAMSREWMKIPYRWVRWGCTLGCYAVGTAGLWCVDEYVDPAVTRVLAKLGIWVTSSVFTVLVAGFKPGEAIDLVRRIVGGRVA